MNILFYTRNEVAPQFGGIERVTALLAESFTQRYQAHCFSAFKFTIDKDFTKYQFDDTIKIHSFRHLESLVEFINKHQIDIVINQAEHRLSLPLRQALEKAGNHHCRIIFALHVKPCAELDFIEISGPKQDFLAGRKRIKSLRKCLTLMYKKQLQRYRLPKFYRRTYITADKLVLLSQNYKVPFIKYANLKDYKKSIDAIPNAVTFPTFFDINHYDTKEKVVLIVARLEEKQKRISLALKIWKTIEEDHQLNDWCLKIVGHGHMDQWYQQLAADYGLKRVSFEGMQNPEPYYEKSAVFMMTSSYEGFPMTLLETMQKGCVPLAFNTFESISDLITNGQNGFIIPEMDFDTYIKQLKRVMHDDKLRQTMAAHAIENSRNFSIENVTQQWMKLFHEVLADEKSE